MNLIFIVSVYAVSFQNKGLVKVNMTCFPHFRLHPHNVLGIRTFADQYMCNALVDDCNSYIEKHFVETSRSEEFSSLMAEELETIIKNDQLRVCNEEQVGLMLSACVCLCQVVYVIVFECVAL